MLTKVVKFGGSSLADAAHFRRVADIIRSDPARRFVVPSAPGKRSKKLDCLRMRDGRLRTSRFLRKQRTAEAGKILRGNRLVREKAPVSLLHTSALERQFDGSGVGMTAGNVAADARFCLHQLDAPRCRLPAEGKHAQFPAG